MYSEKSRAERIIEQINSTNAKRVAVALVIIFVCYHGLLHLKYGIDSCRWLLSDGRYKGNQEWQPYGCMLHKYSERDTRRCLRYLAFYETYTYFVFIGDSRIQELYKTFVKHLQYDSKTTTTNPDINTNLTHVDHQLKLKVEFIWSPYISSYMEESLRNWRKAPHPPTVIILGCGLWSIKTSNASMDSVQEYRMNLTRLVQPIDYLEKSKVLWALQEPVNPDKLKPEYRMISNELIDLYNKEAIEVLSFSEAQLWWSARLVTQGIIWESSDGIHPSDRALDYKSQILLNMYCNDYMNFNDGTCCSSAENSTTLQIVTFSILGICSAIAGIMIVWEFFQKLRARFTPEYTLLLSPDQVNPTQDINTFFLSIAKLTAIMTYFFVCDRTNFFMKENKYYSEFSFWLPIGYIFALGLFFTEDSKFTKVLHRDQMDEWKGWMQMVILVYHITGANQILPINMHIKVLISAYLFLLGYQRFCYVWHRADTGMVTFFKDLFQLNFLTIILCLCMNRPYQFYNFVPLMSFWYMMIYVVLTLPPQITAQTSENNIVQYFYLVIKFICFFTVITVLFMSEVFFEKVFVTRPWKALFVTTDDDIHEWWSRWKLDRYSTLYGMLYAAIHIMAQRYSIFDDNNHNNLFSKGIALSATFAALIGIGSYITFTFLCYNEQNCSEIHSYIVFLPIVSYIVLRNISGVLRTRYSTLFSWFGCIFVELFVCQYHIWLAADTHGVLVLIPGYPVLNVIITSFIFVCASHEINVLTKAILPYAIPNDWKLLLRNVILFLAILVPIGINDGMF